MKFSPRTVTAVLAACTALGLTLSAQPAGAAEPPPVDTTPKTDLPPAEAVLDLADAVAYCQTGPKACTFTIDSRTRSYYEPAHPVGEHYVNCTRSTLSHEQRVSFRDDTFDNVNQTQQGLFPHPTLAQPEATSAMAQQFEKAVDSPDDAWTWTRSEDRTVRQTIETGEAGWVEAQSPRKRVYGSFRPAGGDGPRFRIDVIVDSPSSTLPHRLFQRSGPLTPAEVKRCQSQRPSAASPGGAGAPAGA